MGSLGNASHASSRRCTCLAASESSKLGVFDGAPASNVLTAALLRLLCPPSAADGGRRTTLKCETTFTNSGTAGSSRTRGRADGEQKHKVRRRSAAAPVIRTRLMVRFLTDF
jgi:hypothetical protein